MACSCALAKINLPATGIRIRRDKLLASPSVTAAHWLAVSSELDHLPLETIRLFVTEKVPETPLARMLTRFLSASLSTTPSSVM